MFFWGRLMSSFFDPSLIQMADGAFIREAEVDRALNRLIPRAHISKGSFTYPSKSELRDLAWNHMDQHHRPYIHRTYGAASRIFISKPAAFSLTRFGRWPIILPVFDGCHKENGFYQVIVMLGLLVVINVIECNPDANGTKMDVTWAIASHRWLRFLHPILHRRLVRLNDVQNREDDVMRDRRVELRAAGYHFKTDVPDFLNSNVVENNTLFPPISVPGVISLASLPEGSAIEVPVSNRSFIFKREGSEVDVWPGVCPHEGAEIKVGDLNGKLVKCPWHGLEFGARRLTAVTQELTVCGAQLTLSGKQILVGSPPSRG